MPGGGPALPQAHRRGPSPPETVGRLLALFLLLPRGREVGLAGAGVRRQQGHLEHRQRSVASAG